MTSRRLFFKVMREDMRHRVGMVVLSVLESFLLLPVAWLIFTNQLGGSVQIHGEELYGFMQDIIIFFDGYLMLTGSLIAVSSVLTAGLGGFRFLFHKNMVDTYHSMPVSRDVLYGACYVNGILVWFVPFFVCFSLTLALAGGLVYEMAGGDGLKSLIGAAVISLLTLIIAFLLLYHLVLVAVMLSGNILNSLIGTLILGFGVGAVYLLVSSFMTLYLYTFCEWGLGGRSAVIYSSPLLAAASLVITRVESPEELWYPLLIFLGVAALLGLWAWLLYRKRSSELAEQGIQSKIATTVFRVLVSAAAGMFGWLLFVLLTDYKSLSWGLFGGVFMGMVAFGMMNVAFTMDFKTFFAHKRQMVLTLAVTLIACCAFRGDWMGYDTYLPKGQIKEISFYQSSLNHDRYHTWMRMDSLQSVHFQDEAAISAFLERMVWREREETRGDTSTGNTIVVMVTPARGSLYYREYAIHEEDRDVLWPLFTSREYLESNYCVDETLDWNYFAFVRGRKKEVETYYSYKTLTSIIQAYNQDVLENPELILTGGERLLVQIELQAQNKWQQEWISLDVYESMEHTLEALRQAGYEEWTKAPDPSEIEAVEFGITYTASRQLTAEELIEKARTVFGSGDEAADEQYEYSEYGVLVDEEFTAEFYDCRLRITDPDEIEELAACLSYAKHNTSVFHNDYAIVTVTGKDGGEESLYIQRGMLPEKYILKFGEL